MIFKNFRQLFFLEKKYHLLDHVTRFSTKNVGILGAPFFKGQRKPGTEIAPKVLRQYGLIEELNKFDNITVKDYGDLKYKTENVEPMENALNFPDVYSMNKALAIKIQEILKGNDKYILLGGDHSIGFGSVAGHLAHDHNICVVWIDAHADLNTNTSSVSGNVHGMPLSFILEEMKHYYSYYDFTKIIKNYLPARNLIYIGLRDVEKFEADMIKTHGIQAYSMREIEKFGIPKMLEMILDSIPNKNNVHISFDVDSMDPTFTPSTGTPVPGGLTMNDIKIIFEEFRDLGKVTGFDITEFNPLLGNDKESQKTAEIGIEALKIIMGKMES